ncbi:MAG: sigma 54-interacting transcriptional regulator [Polyangiales bacterium]
MPDDALDALDALARSLQTRGDKALDAELTRVRRLVAQQARAHDELAATVARYQTVLSRALEVAATTGLVPVAGKVIDAMLEVTGAQRAFLGLVNDDGAWDLLVARASARGDLDDARKLLSTTILAEVLRSGEPVVTHDANLDGPMDLGASIVALGLRSVACLPLNRDGRTIGFAYLDDPRTTGLFDAAALTALRAWLPLAADAVARAMDREGGGAGPLGLPTRSERLRAELEHLARVAAFDVSVLLTGETGTGKSLLARKVHEASPRARRAFVHVNCGAIPEGLIEAELFGAEAGAYTGAKGARAGRFEAADGGTLFLDELDTMPIACQVKLLVALQERAVTRLGSNTPVPVDVRVLAAMSAEPARAIAEGRLREDLYYRLAVIEARIPPLRERREDLALLARATLEQTRHRYGLPPLRLGDRALAQLMAHDWPGNVREFQNALDRAALLSRDGEIADVRLSPPGRVATSIPAAPALLDALEAAAVRYVDEVQSNPQLRGIDLVDGFRGLVVAEAVRRFGGRDEAFRALGEGTLVDNRNHHRVLRREVERLQALKERLGVRG